VQEIIGTGLIDALKNLGDDTTVADLATNMENLATYTADVIRGFGLMAAALKKIPGLSGLTGASVVQAIPILGSYITLLNQAGAQARRAAEVGAQKNPIQSGSYLSTQKKITALTKEQQKAQAKILADKKSQAILDKANLALAKGTDVFDMDKIQLNAALIGQAEALGKATTGSQILAIANDVQRLKIKQDIAALEDAIASKDTAAIERATKKLNEDLKILGTLQNQAVKLADIKSILDSIIPKDLIDQQNLDDALEKIKKMMLLLAGGLGTINLGGNGGVGGSSEIDLTTIPKRPRLTGKESIGAIIEVADASATLANAIAAEIEARNAAASKALDESILSKIAAAAAQATIEANRERYGNQGSAPVVTIVDKTSGLIEVVQTAVQENNRFGNNLNFAGAL
jgi:hypothetical protein